MAIHQTKVTARYGQQIGLASGGYTSHDQARRDMQMLTQDWPLLQFGVQQLSDKTFTIVILADLSPAAGGVAHFAACLQTEQVGGKNSDGSGGNMPNSAYVLDGTQAPGGVAGRGKMIDSFIYGDFTDVLGNA